MYNNLAIETQQNEITHIYNVDFPESISYSTHPSHQYIDSTASFP
jgi:hypothetical protein